MDMGGLIQSFPTNRHFNTKYSEQLKNVERPIAEKTEPSQFALFNASDYKVNRQVRQVKIKSWSAGDAS